VHSDGLAAPTDGLTDLLKQRVSRGSKDCSIQILTILYNGTDAYPSAPASIDKLIA
jgi:hypothetical protein